MKFKKKTIFTPLLLVSLVLQADNYTNPNSFDLRDIDGKSYINDVKNQDPYGTCYAFGTTGAAESAYNYNMGLYAKDRASFSETFIIWSLGQKYSGFPTDKNGEGGSSAYDSMQALVDYGVISDKTLAYNQEIMQSYIADEIDKKLNYYWDEPKVKFAGWHRLPVNDIETMKMAITKFGALETSIESTKDWSDYRGDIFFDNYNSSTRVIDQETKSNHRVSLIGWTQDDAWILRNSWAEDWGESGYMRSDFLSAGVSIKSAYFNYLPWSSYEFEKVSINNTSDIRATTQDAGYQIVSRGIYKWGDNNSKITNTANITAEALNQDKFSFTHGIYLWAGDESSITNSATIKSRASSNDALSTAYGVLLQGSNIQNSGFIEAQASSSNDKRATSYGIRHYSFDKGSTLKNSGSIVSDAATKNGWAYGVYASDVTLVENSGSITAKAYSNAIGLMSDGQRYADSTVVNHANIEAISQEDAYGIFSYYSSIINKGTVISKSTSDFKNEETYGLLSYQYEYLQNNAQILIANEGNIKVDSKNSAYGVATFNANNIINSGNIDVNTVSGTAVGVLAINTEVFINSGTITATSRDEDSFGVQLENVEMFVNRGVISANGTNATALATINSNIHGMGTINGNVMMTENSYLGGTGTYNGNVEIESSIVSPGNSIGTLTINGDYSQDAKSKLSIEIDKISSDKLIVGGDIRLEKGTTLELVPLEYINSTSYTSFLQSSSTDGEFIIDVPVVLSAALSELTGNFSLDIKRNTYASLGATSSQKSVATALESLRPTASKDIENTLNNFEMQRNLKSFQTSLSELTPNFHTSTSYALVQNAFYIKDSLNEHMQDIRKVDKKEAHAWGSLLLSNSKVDKKNDILEYEQNTQGIVLGVDKEILKNLKVGLATSLTNQRISEENSISRAKSYNGHLYATYGYNNWFISSSLSFAKVDISSDRKIDFLSKKATSEHSGELYALSALSGYEYKIDKTMLIPSLELTYASLRDNSFSESGADDINLQVDAHRTSSLKSSLGFELSYTDKKGDKYVKPNIYTKWVHEYLGSNEELRANFIASGASFVSQSRDEYRDKTILGGGIDIGFSKNIFLSLEAQSVFSSQASSDYNLNARLRFAY